MYESLKKNRKDKSVSLFLLGLLFFASETRLNRFDYRKSERSVLRAELNIDEIKAQSHAWNDGHESRWTFWSMVCCTVTHDMMKLRAAGCITALVYTQQ